MKSLFTKINDSAGLLQGSPSPFEGKREPVYWSAAQGTEIEDKDIKGLYFLGAVWEITVLGSTVTIVGFEVCNSLLCTLKRYLLNIQLGIGRYLYICWSGLQNCSRVYCCLQEVEIELCFTWYSTSEGLLQITFTEGYFLSLLNQLAELQWSSCPDIFLLEMG